MFICLSKINTKMERFARVLLRNSSKRGGKCDFRNQQHLHYNKQFKTRGAVAVAYRRKVKCSDCIGGVEAAVVGNYTGLPLRGGSTRLVFTANRLRTVSVAVVRPQSPSVQCVESVVQSVAVSLAQRSLHSLFPSLPQAARQPAVISSLVLSSAGTCAASSCLNYRMQIQTQPKRQYSSETSTVAAISLNKRKMPEVKPFARLPENVIPRHYTLALRPDLKTFAFQGDVSVQIEVKSPTATITMNVLDLFIGNVSLLSVAEDCCGTQINLKNQTISTETETAELVFDKPIPVGKYLLNIAFTGEINDKMKGLYRSKYTNEKGEDCFAAVTQFESTDARRCFPCWDEPALKATFDISLLVPTKLEALSNMPVKSSKEENGRVLYQFETTPIMSTYLVAAVVGEYDYVEGKSEDGVLVRVYTPRGKKEQGLFALEVATKVLPYYKEYFNIAYPLPKIDLIAIADFSAGAMENWGLVTYRETCLLVDPQNTSAVRKQWIALVVGHELAHQWFGNLVTMEWWTHLWLNEGYASFVEFLCVNHLFPEYDIWTQFVNETYIRALELDCLRNSHPIEVPVGHPSEIDEIFDDISYNKGASIIRMLHHYIGDADFRKGMHLYLTRHQYKNTFTEDLWAALEEASSKPVGDVMSSWTKQMGFPVVKVKETERRGNDVTLTLDQRKFCADGNEDATKDYLWMVPISIATAKDPRKECVNTVLKTRSCEIVVPNVGETDWIKINPGTIGYYRTQYPSSMLEKFLPDIRNLTLPPLDRLGLLDDLFALVQAGQSSTVDVLRLLPAFIAEQNYTVWSSISNVLTKLKVLLSHTDMAPQFAKYERDLLSQIATRLGWTPKSADEKHLDTLLRGLILGRLAWLDDPDTQREAKVRFQRHIAGEEQIPADLRSACYKAVLRCGGADTFDQMLALYRRTDLHEEKDRISRALGAAKEMDLLKRVLEFAMSNEVRSQDTVFVIMSVAMTRPGQELAWNFFKDNWRTLLDRYQGGFLLARFVKFVTENFASEERAREIEEFFAGHKSPGTERTVQQAVETIRLNAAWLNRDTDAIREFLNSK